MMINYQSVSPVGLFNETSPEHPRFHQWQSIIGKFRPILEEGGTPTVFVSHAWHRNVQGQSIDSSPIAEASYYDQIDFHLSRVLKSAGFKVLYDKDITNVETITSTGTTPFMEKLQQVDIVISLCTPLYHARSVLPGSGVKIEVDTIQQRIIKTKNLRFFIPILIHASNSSYDPKDLFIGKENDSIRQALYIDWREKSTFISNIWKLLYRLWENVNWKWEDNPKFNHSQQSRLTLTHQYVSVLGELLQIEDFYDLGNHHQLLDLATCKEGMKMDYKRLKILTTPLQDISLPEIAQLINQEFFLHQDLFNASKDQHIVAFLGNTGAGKSTIINFLANKELKCDQYQQGYELRNPFDSSALRIGVAADSSTLYPQWIDLKPPDEIISSVASDGLFPSWFFEYSDPRALRFFDLPGFNDTSGTVRNLINSAFIQRILTQAASVRLVFVAGQDEVTVNRSENIKKLFTTISGSFLSSPEVIERHSLLLVTKSTFPLHEKALANQYLFDKLQSAYGTHLQAQLQMWQTQDRLFFMPHPRFKPSDEEFFHLQKKILSAIQQNAPVPYSQMQKFQISNFYPPETTLPIKKWFFHLMEERCIHLQQQLQNLTVCQYDPISANEIAFYRSESFWMEFPNDICEFKSEISLLKEIFSDSFDQSLELLRQEHESIRQSCLRQVARGLVGLFSQVLFEKFSDSLNSLFQSHMTTHLKYQRDCDIMVSSLSATLFGKVWLDFQVNLPQWKPELAVLLFESNVKGIYEDAFHMAQKEFMNHPNILSKMKSFTEQLQQRRSLLLPEIVRGNSVHEETFRRFTKGILIYKPDPINNPSTPIIELPFSSLSNPLDGAFDLSTCGCGIGSVQIFTGYNYHYARYAGQAITEMIWIVPHFAAGHVPKPNGITGDEVRTIGIYQGYSTHMNPQRAQHLSFDAFASPLHYHKVKVPVGNITRCAYCGVMNVPGQPRADALICNGYIRGNLKAKQHHFVAANTEEKLLGVFYLQF